jgi:predicted PurR-regulated permease PerM
VLFTFIASKGLDSIINLVIISSILFIFNVKYAFLLGLIAGLFNFIPYLGSLIVIILISAITLITGGLSQAIKVLIPLLVFQQIDGNFIEPRIMKSSLKISPILVILAVVVGGAYFGIIGMFLAVPLAAIIKQVLIEYVSLSESE